MTQQTSTPFSQALAEYNAAVADLLVRDANRRAEQKKNHSDASDRLCNTIRDELHLDIGTLTLGWQADGRTFIELDTAPSNEGAVVAFATKHSATLKLDNERTSFTLVF